MVFGLRKTRELSSLYERSVYGILPTEDLQIVFCLPTTCNSLLYLEKPGNGLPSTQNCRWSSVYGRLVDYLLTA